MGFGKILSKKSWFFTFVGFFCRVDLSTALDKTPKFAQCYAWRPGPYQGVFFPAVRPGPYQVVFFSAVRPGPYQWGFFSLLYAQDRIREVFFCCTHGTSVFSSCPKDPWVSLLLPGAWRRSNLHVYHTSYVWRSAGSRILNPSPPNPPPLLIFPE